LERLTLIQSSENCFVNGLPNDVLLPKWFPIDKKIKWKNNSKKVNGRGFSYIKVEINNYIEIKIMKKTIYILLSLTLLLLFAFETPAFSTKKRYPFEFNKQSICCWKQNGINLFLVIKTAKSAFHHPFLWKLSLRVLGKISYNPGCLCKTGTFLGFNRQPKKLF
jgi:hypothetical protein